MAQDKKAVLLYCDIIHTVEKMDNETAGEFFKHYLRYVNDLHPTTENLIVDIAFESVKQNLKRDLKKWGDIQKSKIEAGSLGNLKRWHPNLYKKVVKGGLGLDEAWDVANKRNPIKPKEKEKSKPKEKTKAFTPPSYEEFMIYVKSKCTSKEQYFANKQNIEWKYNAWETAGWLDGNNKQIKNWKSKVNHNMQYLIKT